MCHALVCMQSQAAKELGVSLTTLKQACRNFGISRWPYGRVPFRSPCMRTPNHNRHSLFPNPEFLHVFISVRVVSTAPIPMMLLTASRSPPRQDPSVSSSNPLTTPLSPHNPPYSLTTPSPLASAPRPTPLLVSDTPVHQPTRQGGQGQRFIEECTQGLFGEHVFHCPRARKRARRRTVCGQQQGQG